MDAERRGEFSSLEKYLLQNPHVLYNPDMANIMTALQKMGDSSAEVIEENQESTQLSKAKAMEAIADAKFSEAIDHLSEAIMLTPKFATFYANRDLLSSELEEDPNFAEEMTNSDFLCGLLLYGIMLDFPDSHHQSWPRYCLQPLKLISVTATAMQQMSVHQRSSVLKDGEVIAIHCGGELKDKTVFMATYHLDLHHGAAPAVTVYPVFTALVAKYVKGVFLKADVDEARVAAFEWKVSSIPTSFFVKNGIEVDQFTWNADEQKIAQHAQ